MKKYTVKFLSLLLVFVMAFAFVGCGETEPEEEPTGGNPSTDTCYALNSAKNAYVYTGSKTKDETSVVVSSTYNGLPVKAIGDEAFGENRSLTSVTLPEGIESIGAKAFKYCKKLTTIALPSTLKTIGKEAFCSSGLNQITFNDGLLSIGEKAFQGVRTLTQVVIPDSVSELGFNSFENCTGILSITIGKGLKEIKAFAFNGCTSCTTLSLPQDGALEIIGANAFSDCKKISEVIIPDTVKTIGDQAFHNTFALNHLVIGAKVEFIAGGFKQEGGKNINLGCFGRNEETRTYIASVEFKDPNGWICITNTSARTSSYVYLPLSEESAKIPSADLSGGKYVADLSNAKTAGEQLTWTMAFFSWRKI